MLIGRVDDIDDGVIYGWAFDKASPNDRVNIRILWGEKEVYHGKVDKYRSDLHQSGFGDGYCSFEVPISDVKFDDPITVFALGINGSTMTLPKAQREERHLSRHFDSFSKEYKDALTEMARRLTALEARFERREREADSNHVFDQVASDILSIEKKLYETDIYLIRLDERLKKLADRNASAKPGLFARIFLGK